MKKSSVQRFARNCSRTVGSCCLISAFLLQWENERRRVSHSFIYSSSVAEQSKSNYCDKRSKKAEKEEARQPRCRNMCRKYNPVMIRTSGDGFRLSKKKDSPISNLVSMRDSRRIVGKKSVSADFALLARRGGGGHNGPSPKKTASTTLHSEV